MQRLNFAAVKRDVKMLIPAVSHWTSVGLERG